MPCKYAAIPNEAISYGVCGPERDAHVCRSLRRKMMSRIYWIMGLVMVLVISLYHFPLKYA